MGRGAEQAAFLQVALHVTKRPNGGMASDREFVGGGHAEPSKSFDARGEVVSGSCLGSSSFPGQVGKANSKRVGRFGSGGGDARQASSAAVSRFVVGLCMWITVVFGGCGFQMHYELKGPRMRIIYVDAQLRGTVGAEQAAFLQVALHVTKRPNGGMASDREFVGGGHAEPSKSFDARGEVVSGSPSRRWSGEFDASAPAVNGP